jgi:flavin reductase (DIM6/NTAB) family NADH-FMN oxidoreductase RutF
MKKIAWKPGTMINPLPAVLISCGSDENEYNIITIAWTGTLCTNPPMCYASIRPGRHSYEIIKKNGEFVINLATEKLAFAVDWCGVKTGKEVNKFKEMKLTPVKAQKVKAPLILESPINIECIVKEIKPLGSHDMFISEVLAVNADEQFFDESGRFSLEKANLIAYSHGYYFLHGKRIGKFGYSVMKKKKNVN